MRVRLAPLLALALRPLCAISKLSETKLRFLKFLTERRKLRLLKLSEIVRFLEFLTERRKLRLLKLPSKTKQFSLLKLSEIVRFLKLRNLNLKMRISKPRIRKSYSLDFYVLSPFNSGFFSQTLV